MGTFFLWLIWPIIVVKLTKVIMRAVGKSMTPEDAQQMREVFTRAVKSSPIRAILPSEEVIVEKRPIAREALIGVGLVVGISVISAVITVKVMNKK